jgi:hypothetical protein
MRRTSYLVVLLSLAPFRSVVAVRVDNDKAACILDRVAARRPPNAPRRGKAAGGHAWARAGGGDGGGRGGGEGIGGGGIGGCVGITLRSPICFSVNLARFIGPSFVRPDSNSPWRKPRRRVILMITKSVFRLAARRTVLLAGAPELDPRR